MNPLYKIAGKVGKEVAEGLVNKAKPIAKKVEDVVEDWGFKPKPGEVSGTEFLKAQNKVSKLRAKYSDVGINNIPEKDISELYKNRDITDKFFDQISDAYDKEKLTVWDSGDEIYDAANLFKQLEKQGVPRKYTGKIVKFYGDNWPINENYEYGEFSKIISDDLKSLTPVERDIYINLFKHKNIDSTVDWLDLHKDVKNITKNLTESQQETFTSLLPEWEGTIEDLIQTAKTL